MPDLIAMYEYSATILDVHDGDTVTADIDLGFRIHFTMKLRLLGIDAPELTHAGGPESRDFLKNLLLNKTVTIKTQKDHTEKYGRYLATIFLPTLSPADPPIDVNDLMIAKGYAVKYAA